MIRSDDALAEPGEESIRPAAKSFNGDCQRDIDCDGTEAHFAVARLVAEFTVHGDGAFRRPLGHMKLRLDGERAGKDGELLVADLNLLRLRVGHLLGLEWPSGPGELDGNDVFVLRLVAIDVEALANRQVQRLLDGCTGFGEQRLRRGDVDRLIDLREQRGQRQRQAEGEPTQPA